MPQPPAPRCSIINKKSVMPSFPGRLVLCFVGLICFVGIRLISLSISIHHQQRPSIDGGSLVNNNNNNKNEAILPDPFIITTTTSSSTKNVDSSNLISRSSSNNNNNTSTTTTTILKHPNFLIDFPLCLVHVGKSAGSSVSCGLGLTYADCEGMPRDRLPNTYYMHIRKSTCPPNNKIRTYLVTVRNPITRLQSWFDFEKDIIPARNRNQHEQEMIRKKRSLLFVDCYTNFSDFASIGLQPFEDENNNLTIPNMNRKPINMTCPQRAWAATLGVRAFSYHEYYNYEYYYEKIHQNGYNNNNNSSKLYVLRTEHLETDWNTISTKEPLFRPVNQKRKKGSSNYNDNALPPPPIFFTKMMLNNLCHALCPEIQFYKRILIGATNLNKLQQLESMEEIQHQCPMETSLDDIRTCPDIPTFPRMIVPRSKYDAEIKKRLFQIK